MVSDSYLIDKPPPPSELKRLFDQRVIPVAIDGLATFEAGIERLARLVRRAPCQALGLAFSIGLAAAVRKRA